jgi:prepilin-type N-terminal cleavage/methylation domain-containing protein
MSLRKLNRRGDTLVEVIIALAVLSVVLFAAYTITGRAARVGQAAKERTQGVAFAQQQAEIIQSYAARNWDDFVEEVTAPGLGARQSFDLDTWQPQQGSLEIPEEFSDAAADYEVFYTYDETTTGSEVTQIEFTINVNWIPVDATELDDQGQAERQSTTIVVRVSPTEVNNET